MIILLRSPQEMRAHPTVTRVELIPTRRLETQSLCTADAGERTIDAR